MRTTTLVSWNLKGSARPDLSAIVDHLRAENADVVSLQEVQWHQARAIARALRARSWRWGFKHWPLRTWPEGMAVIGVTRRAEVRTLALSHRWRLWSWRRRIVQVASVAAAGDRPEDGATGAADTDTFTLINVHLTPHGETGLRAAETATVLALVAERTGPVVVCGDLNERPGGAIHRQMATAGLRDGWAERPDRTTATAPTTETVATPRATDATAQSTQAPSGTAWSVDPWPTNWRGWRPGTTELPTQQLDYVYASAAVASVSVRTPAPGHVGFERFARLSDHLPVTAEIALP